jgi:hypothetical protein
VLTDTCVAVNTMAAGLASADDHLTALASAAEALRVKG